MEQLANLIWIGMVGGGFCLLLVLGELIANALYDLIPTFRLWVDEQDKPGCDEEAK
jgi:hypothetical protein